jgi:hypothetical protein
VCTGNSFFSVPVRIDQGHRLVITGILLKQLSGKKLHFWAFLRYRGGEGRGKNISLEYRYQYFKKPEDQWSGAQ